MDHKQLCSAFRPPPPFTMATYFDQVTQGKAVPSAFLVVQRLDEVLRIIESRSSPVEQAALLSELEDRFIRYGQQHGWLAPPAPKTPDQASDMVLAFVIQDLLGVQGDSAQSSVIATLQDQLKEIIQDALNSRGRKAFGLLQLLLDLAECKTPEDVVKVLAACGLGKLGAWLAKEETRKAVIKAIGKRVGMNAKARNKVIRLVAARLTWLEVSLARLAWVMPVLAALDVFLTPESTADDATMWRLTFLTAYGRMQAKRRSQFGQLVNSCAPGANWSFRAPLRPTLATAIQAMH